MKVKKVSVEAPKTFNPIKVEITMETLKDLQWLRAIANTTIDSASLASEGSPVGFPSFQEGFSSIEKAQMSFYNAIDDIAKEYVEANK